MSPAQFGDSVISGFVLGVPVPVFTILDVDEPYVVSVFRKSVFVESGVAGFGVLIESEFGEAGVCIPIGPFHYGYMHSPYLVLFLFFSCSPIFLDSTVFLLVLLSQFFSLDPSFELIICYLGYFSTILHLEFEIRFPVYIIMLGIVVVVDESSRINYLQD